MKLVTKMTTYKSFFKQNAEKQDTKVNRFLSDIFTQSLNIYFEKRVINADDFWSSLKYHEFDEIVS